MVLHNISIDGINHSIYMKTANKTPYYKLCNALMSGISDADQANMTNKNKKDKKIMYFTDIVRCFEGVEFLNTREMTSCICGKQHISDNYLIRNKTTLEEHIVGSTCAKNWFEDGKNEDACKYCNRNSKNGGDCINCCGKANLKSAFSGWRNELKERKEMVSFGKYKGILTYRQLCEDIKYKSYVDWCLNKSQMSAGITERLQYFSDKSGKD
jgi:hypothetical protein